jgi:hypothetical protein
MSLAESPPIENEIVLSDLRECAVKGASSGSRQYDIVEGAVRHDRVNGTAATHA